MTLPVFLGQLISAYEGIGCVSNTFFLLWYFCGIYSLLTALKTQTNRIFVTDVILFQIIPIESSMEDNYQKMPMLLHIAVYIVFAILCSFGTLGYLRFGANTQEIIVLNFTSGWLIKLVDVVLIISVLFTYPLQCFPVIEIVESYLFAPGEWLVIYIFYPVDWTFLVDVFNTIHYVFCRQMLWSPSTTPWIWWNWWHGYCEWWRRRERAVNRQCGGFRFTCYSGGA